MVGRPQSTAERVFGVAELAEAIFLELPPKDILLDQRVCKQWQAVVESSITIKKALFLLPASDAQVCFHGPATGGRWATSAAAPATTVFENPLMSRRFGAGGPRDNAVIRPDASWRNMLIAQPPISKVDFYHFAPHLGYSGMSWDDGGGSTIEARGHGLRMRELEDHCRATSKLDCWLIKGDMIWTPTPWKYKSANSILDVIKKGEVVEQERMSDGKTAKKIKW